MAIPVTLFEAKEQLQIGQGDWDRDHEIAGFIEDAAAWIEGYTGHILEARDVTEQFTGFDRLRLRAWPILPTAVPVVSYAGPPVEPIIVPGARIDASRRPARLLPSAGYRWPFVARDTTVTVTVRAGYEAGSVVPGNLRRAMLILISAYDADREGGEVFARAEASAQSLCRRLKARSL